MNLAAVGAASVAGILLLGWLTSPAMQWPSPEIKTKHDKSVSVRGDKGEAILPPTLARRTSTAFFADAQDPTPSRGQTVGAQTDVENSTALNAEELSARRDRSEDTFRRLQESFRVREAREATSPKEKSTRTNGGMGTPLVCEPNQHGKAIIHDPIPFGFIFDPKEYPNGRIELRNVQSVPLVVTVRGDEQVLINGQPATTGVEYPIEEGLEITSPGQVRIHVAPGTAPKTALDGRG